MEIFERDTNVFSFDGQTINFYKCNMEGELRTVCENFEENDEKTGRIEDELVLSQEHTTVGDIAFQLFFESLSSHDQNFFEKKLKQTGLASFRKVKNGDSEQLYVDFLVGSNRLRAGMIVALGGYYSIPDEPIACDLNLPSEMELTSIELEKRFLAAFQTLVLDVENEAPIILKQIGFDGNTIHGLIKRKAQPSIVMGASKSGNSTWADLTSRSLAWKKHIPGGFFIERYMQAATMNFDHFGSEAENAYTAGHHLALQLAAAASELPDDDEQKWKTFSEALILELFAGHFFADLFVSGHVRTPRKKVFEILNGSRKIKTKWIAALFANQMHDEDNEKGVYVCSENHPDPWMAMGDYRYSDDDSSTDNEVYVHRAMAERLRELYTVFCKETDLKTVMMKFKKDIPREATLQWLEHCGCGNTPARLRALEHTRKFQPLLRVGAGEQLEMRPNYRPINRKEMLLNLADMIYQGLTGEAKAISGHDVQEITRIKLLCSQNSSDDEMNFEESFDNLVSTDNVLKKKILEELYLMENADEVIVGIERPTAGS